MKKNYFNFNIIAVVACSFIFLISCQKEQALPAQDSLQNEQSNSILSQPNSDKQLSDKEFDKVMRMIIEDMMQQMNSMERTCDPDIDFANMMVIHHEAGIKM